MDPLPDNIDLRPEFAALGLAPRMQGGRPTCSVFTVAGGLEYAAARATGRGAPLSIEFLNWAGHSVANRTADGGFFSELWDGFAEYGLCLEERLPYQDTYDAALQPRSEVVSAAGECKALGLALHWIKEWDPKTGLTGEQLERVRATLAAGWPVCGGFRWPKQPLWEDGLLRMCGPDEVYDGHSVLLVGYRDADGGIFLIRNSGKEGPDCRLPYEYVQAYMNDAAWISCPGEEACSIR